MSLLGIIDASSEGSAVAQWEQAGLATQREVVQVEVEAKFVCWRKCEIGVCEIGDKRLVRCNIIFSNLKKKF